MKANRKFIEGDERADSAVIGVILMVATTVAIAAIVYVYVSGMIGNTEPDVVLCGKIKYLPISDQWTHYGVLQMDNNCFYSIYHMYDSDYALLKFAFMKGCTVSLILSTSYNGNFFIKDKSVSLLDYKYNGD